MVVRGARARPPGPRGALGRPLVLGLLLALAVAPALVGCIVRRVAGPQLTGTCDGACTHYLQCKPGHGDADKSRCLAECPSVFSDRDSLMAYESLSCEDAVEFVDGISSKTAAHNGP
jgi:hypothetical protein